MIFFCKILSIVFFLWSEQLIMFPIFKFIIAASEIIKKRFNQN